MFIKATQGFIDISTKTEIWHDIAKELNGKFIIKHTTSNDLERFVLTIPYKDYLIEFSESDTQPLKINCKMKAKQKFEFTVSCEDKIELLFKLFGRQDIKLGDDKFDKKYIIKCDNIAIIKNLLSINEIKQIILSNNIFSYNCKYIQIDNTNNLWSLINRTTNSKSELYQLIKLFYMSIDKMQILNLIV